MNKHNLCRFIIKSFCKTEMNWPREIKICKKLIEEYPNQDFWEKLELGFKLNTTAWFLTDVGQELLNKNKYKKDLVIEEKIKPAIFDNKVGEDKILSIKKPKNIYEYLD